MAISSIEVLSLLTNCAMTSHKLVIRVCTSAALAFALAGCQRLPPAAAAPEMGEVEEVTAADAFRAAEAAFMRHDFQAAEKGYREVLATDTSAERQLSAAIVLANIAWRIRQDTATARTLLLTSSSMEGHDVDVPIERAHMRLAFQDFAGARAAARQALALASVHREESRATSALARGIIEPILVRLHTASGPLVVRETERANLRALVPRLTTVVRATPGAVEPAHLLLLAGVLSGNGSAIVEGWDSYYLIGTGRPAGNLIAEARGILSTLVPGWVDRSAPVGDRLALVRVLADGRFFEAAALVALLPAPDGTVPGQWDEGAEEIVAYARFLRQISSFADEFYRRTAMGTGEDVEGFQSGILSAAAELWPHLVWIGEPEPLSWESLPEVLAPRFGTFYRLGLTSGYPSLHMGHRVVDEARVVRQYGREAVVRFISLDAIVSNGFQTWAWGGRASTGGWGTATQIVQIRPAYAEGPLAAWRAATDKEIRARAAKRIAADSIADIARARLEPIAYFPSVPARLLRDGRDQLIDSLRAAGLAGTDLEAAFKREYARAILESSIFAHEGRHAIDQTYEPDLSSEELEFRGKISQVVFAPHPGLGAVSGVFQANIGDETPHGQANARIMKGLLAWMRARADEIQGLNHAEPLLPQLPLLTAEQLRAAFGSMDPLTHLPL